MEEKFTVILFILIPIGIYIFGLISGHGTATFKYKMKSENILREQKREIDSYKRKVEKEINNSKLDMQEKLSEYNDRMKDLSEREEVIKGLIGDLKAEVPFVVDLYSRYATAKDEYIASQLQIKPNPALKGAEEVKRINTEKRTLLKELALLEFTVKYYETLYPILKESKDDSFCIIDNEEKNTEYDYAKDYLSQEEYSNLSSIEKYQLALDRYKLKHVSKYEIGKRYEQCIGYLYQKDGYDVCFHGIIKGYEDLGRDLICIKNGITHVIQCKNWSKKKLIHENTVNQIYGTTVKYWLDNIKPNIPQISVFDRNMYLSEFMKDYKHGYIKAVIYTSTLLSETATEFAESLGVEVHECFELQDYPMIKCNINKATKEKIYHLPFDLQYDTTKISAPGEKYAFTVKEAEESGFRRAKKWIEKTL